MVSFVIHHHHESSKNVRSTRDYLKADYSKIRTELATIDWDATLTGSAAECAGLVSSRSCKIWRHDIYPCRNVWEVIKRRMIRHTNEWQKRHIEN